MMASANRIPFGLILFFSIQPVLAMLDYFHDGFSSAVNQFFLLWLIWIVAKLGILKSPFVFFLIIALWSFGVGVGHDVVLAGDSLSGVVSYSAKYLTVYLCAAYLLVSKNDEFDDWQIRKLLIWMIVVVATLQILGVLIGVEVGDESYEYALVGLTKHPAITANLIIACLPWALFFAFRGERSFLLIASVLLFLTFRRSAWLVVIIFWVAYFYREIFLKKDFGLAVLVFVLSSVFLYALYLVAPDNIVEGVVGRFDELFSGGEKDAIGSGRDVFWAIVLADFSARSEPLNYVFGFGFGSISDLLYSRFGLAIGAHNDFFDLFYSYGIPAAFLLAGFFVFSFFAVLMKRNAGDEKVVFLTGLLAMFSLSITTGGISDVQLVMYLASMGWLYKRMFKCSHL